MFFTEEYKQLLNSSYSNYWRSLTSLFDNKNEHWYWKCIEVWTVLFPPCSSQGWMQTMIFLPQVVRSSAEEASQHMYAADRQGCIQGQLNLSSINLGRWVPVETHTQNTSTRTGRCFQLSMSLSTTGCSL